MDEEDIDIDAYCAQRGLTPEDCAGCTRSMVGSIKIGYKKHLLLCLKTEPTSWIADITAEGVASRLSQAIKTLNAPFVLTGVHHEVEDASADDLHIIVYPDAFIYTLPAATADFAPFMQELLETTNDAPSMFPKMPAPWGTIILVCSHQARDKRCGRAGPQVIEEMRTHNWHSGG